MVYYKWVSPGRFLVVELREADVATFRPINFCHAVDEKAIWYLDRPIKGSDPSTIQLISNRIVKDAKRVYISGQPKRHLDAKTFQSVGSAYYTDANGVYWGDKAIKGADADTFQVLGESFFAVDKNNVYRSGRLQSHLDSASLKFIMHDPFGYQIVSDKSGVYLNYVKFLHADPDDFKMIDKVTARGGEHVFLVDLYHVTPVTLYQKQGHLIVETILFEKKTANALAIIRAQVGAKSLKDLTLLPPPGETKVGNVPDWQIELFKREDLFAKIKKAVPILLDD